jgi:hypothetical protein
MKKLLLLFTLAITFSCCNNDEDKPIAEIDKLPPATQIGANTFGCLLDGKAFLPGNFPNATNCFYQLVDGEYYFVTSFADDINDNLKVIRLRTEKKQIFEGETYDLFEWIDGNATGNFTNNNIELFTTHTHTGKLTITKLDEVNHIVSGTFWFDVLDNNGVVHQIREGRFDSQYTN